MTVTGSVKPALPGGRALTGAQVRLVRVGGNSGTLITTAKVDTIGRFTFRFRARFGGLYRVVFPSFRDLASTTRNSGRLQVTAG